ncbi:MAG: DNA adenine methylase [Calothrix sp. FI2-JRJ7]|jgi:DNA adenine methylase|nr:DNA adenine methylase [Calothrix sp. FI2-JRJ7]
MTNQPHPIQYQGSKRGIASTILNFLPKKIERLVEPFAGTAAISVAASAQRVSQQYWINDLNKPLIQLLELIIEHPYNVADAYSQVWNEQIGDSIKHYYQIRDKFNTNNDPILFLYIVARCVKGAVRYNNEGLFNQSPDKRRKGTQPEKMLKNIEGVSKLLKGKCVFTSFDYREVLSQVKRSKYT